MPGRGTTARHNGQILTVLDPAPNPNGKRLEPTRAYRVISSSGMTGTIDATVLEQHRIDPTTLEPYPTDAIRGVPRRFPQVIAVPHRVSGSSLICTVIHSTHPSYPVGGYDIAVPTSEVLAVPALRAPSA